jgi:hypothetical protein
METTTKKLNYIVFIAACAPDVTLSNILNLMITEAGELQFAMNGWEKSGLVIFIVGLSIMDLMKV